MDDLSDVDEWECPCGAVTGICRGTCWLCGESAATAVAYVGPGRYVPIPKAAPEASAPKKPPNRPHPIRLEDIPI